MGGPYNIPRDYKGESKILFIFSKKSFIYTAVGGFIGVILFYLFNLLKLTAVGVICVIIFAVLGFAIGTFKIPDVSTFEFTKNVGGEAIDDVIKRWIKFKRNSNRIYVYKEEDAKDDK
ncbi:MAG: PrgI family protein [Clostridia bacterium]|jgi:hypothetical protein|nr:PrgI family protein [Clostridia bacterium]